MTIKDVLTAVQAGPMGQILASRQMMRLRPDGVEDTVTIEIGAPQSHQIDAPVTTTWWTCNVRISLAPFFMVASAPSSLDAIIGTTYLARTVLMSHPCAPEIDMSLLPFFNLPISPVTTTPADLAAEQNRPKEIRSPTYAPPEDPAQPDDPTPTQP